MGDNSYRQDKEELRALLRQYHNLKQGYSYSFIEEEAFERIIDYYDEKEDMASALEAADHGIEQYPYSSILQIKKADILIATRRYKEALLILDKVEILDRGDINLYILKTDAYLALDKQKQAAAILEEAVELFKGEEKIELLFELADVYDDYEEFDKVFNCLKLILEQDPINEEALYKICFWTDYTGRNEEGIRLYEKIIDLHPFNELAWFNLGAAYQGLKLYEKSIDAYQYAIAIDEKFDYAYRNMGDAYLRMRKYKDAIEVLQKVLALTRPEDVIYEAIAHCYTRLKNFAQARFHYRKASHLNPDASHLYYKIACTYMNEEHWESAVKNLETAMRIHRSQPDYNLALAQCYMEMNRVKDAVIYFSNFIKARPKNIKGWKELVKCLYKAGFYEEALEQVHNAIRNTENKPILIFYKSAVLFALENAKEALSYLETAMEKSPKLLKQFIELDPSMLHNQQIIQVIGKHKKNKRPKN
ncbi:MAG: tetratricopeptide repeat protein [Chitinophagaceae bacterium]|nr:tetratricopeptide repeat protein [Chitinophagaceae bacterium]HEV8082380.1 tetratricopeptide repeat protein [Chitinophagaceae bacterium]